MEKNGQNQVKLTSYHNLFFAGAPIPRQSHLDSTESITAMPYTSFPQVSEIAYTYGEDSRSHIRNPQSEGIEQHVNQAFSFQVSHQPDQATRKNSSPCEMISTLSQSPPMVSRSNSNSGSNYHENSPVIRPRILGNPSVGSGSSPSSSQSRENVVATTRE